MTEWIDLGDGEAISAARVAALSVMPPTPCRSRSPFRAFLEEETWGVYVLDGEEYVSHRVGNFWSEGAARQRAQQTVDQMIREANA